MRVQDVRAKALSPGKPEGVPHKKLLAMKPPYQTAPQSCDFCHAANNPSSHSTIAIVMCLVQQA